MNKYTLYVKDHPYVNTAILAVRAAQSLEESEHKDCVYSYGDWMQFTMYAKRNKAGITVTEITDE